MEMSSCRAAACPGVLQLPGSWSLAGDVGQAGTGGQICAQHRRGHEHSPLTWFGSHREVLGGCRDQGLLPNLAGAHQAPIPAAPRGCSTVTPLVPQGPTMDASKKVDLKIIIIGALG